MGSSVPDTSQVSVLALDQYKRLGKIGKPVNGEWTHLACIIECSQTKENDDCVSSPVYKCVSLGTGSKCLSHNRLSKFGDLVNDSHAEVLARRGLLRYFYDQLRVLFSTDNQKNSIFYISQTHHAQIKLKENISFHMFVSYTPCGDASIISHTTDGLDRDPDDEPIQPKRLKLELNDQLGPALRTGAKCCPGELQDSNWDDLQQEGVLRTKPGRGERTLSLSCSDKLLRWQILGLQGALLTYFINDPIRLDSLIVGRCPRNILSFNRAINGRASQASRVSFSSPLRVFFVDINFDDSPSIQRSRPTASSIVWWINGKQEALVNGYRQGLTKRDKMISKAWPAICKFNLLCEFFDVLTLFRSRHHIKIDDFTSLSTKQSYLELKENMKFYMDRRADFFKEFPNWITTPREYYNFCAEDG